ncbi:MAG TPA: DNA translocase FtsK 4TM domain-containing protein [Bacteroidota bacterium]|nr:DNA translocase FtsK 4TM domain-containing protein [Bacteroidota bacterium]
MPQEEIQQQAPAAPRKKKNSGVSKPPSRRTKQIACFFAIVVGVLMFISLATYTSEDEARSEMGFWNRLSTDAVQSQNKIGPIGAIVSNFLINSTIGFPIIILPLLIIAWGWTVLRKGDIRRLTYITNFAIVLALLVSVFFRLLREAGFAELLQKEWHGDIGAFLGIFLSHNIGLTGAFIIVGSFLFVALMLGVDLDLHVTTERLRELFVRAGGHLGTSMDKLKVSRTDESVPEPPAKEIKVKRPDGESAPIVKKPVIPKPEPVVKMVDQELPIEAIKRATVTAKPSVLEGEAPLEIKETRTEAEVELDARDVEDEEIDYTFPSVELLDGKKYEEKISDEELKTNASILQGKLADFGVEVASVSVTPGPVVTLYELVPATGVKVSKIVNLSNDLALVMQAKGIRIEAPIPGKGTVGVEIPNTKSSIVTIRSILNSEKFKNLNAALPIAMGKTVTGEIYVDDLATMPHLLIAGATGMGKSVGINTIIASLLYRLHPSEVKFVLIDPKKIELSSFLHLENHFLAVSADVIDEKILTTPANAVLALKSAVLEMENRYTLLASAGVRGVRDYNERFKSGKLKDKDTETVHHRFLPYIVIIIDELADLMLTTAKEVEESIARLAQMARAVGIHLVLATQRPSVDVITGVIKANFPARIAYAVSSKVDSRTIMDGNGAEQLIGRGDMLYLSTKSPKPIRIQNAYISTDEVEELVEFIAKQKGYTKPFELPSALEKKKGSLTGSGEDRDDLFEEAARIVVRHQQGSVSLLQRRLKVGYSRAARIVDELEAAGIVGPFDGSKARDVIIENESDLEIILGSLD